MSSSVSSAQVSADLQAAYDVQYGDAGFGQWRAVSAQAKAARMLSLINRAGLKPTSVLEVGAGEGSLLAALAEGLRARGVAPELHALEISQSGVEAIQAKGLLGLTRVERFDGYRLPYADASVDLIVLSHVLEHVEYERTLLRELHRVGRRLLVEVPRELQPGADRRWRHFLSYGHVNLYTPASLRFVLITEGFDIEQEHLGVTHPSILAANPTIPITLRARAEYAVRRLLMALPLRSLHERFCNTITVLARPVEPPKLLG